MVDASLSNQTDVCLPSAYKWVYVVLIPLPVLSGLVNVIVWLAATFYRKKLMRQSYVYSCVTSTLLSNALFLSIHLWEEIAGFQMVDMVSMMTNNSANAGVDGELQILWSLCTAATVAMLFVACGNLTVLIYVMLDSAYFRKSVRHRLSSSQGKPRSNTNELESKRRRAAFLVAFVWFLPAVLTLAAVVTWNCAGECTCPPGSEGELCPRDFGCSRIWPPMTNSFIAVNVALWFVEIIVLCYVTVTGIQKYQSYNFPSKRNAMPLDGSPILRKSTSSWVPSCSSVVTAVTTTTDGSRTPRVRSAEIDDDVFQSPSAIKETRRRPRLMVNPRLRLVCYLTIVFVICTVMIPVAFLIDLIAVPLPHIGIRFASMVLVQVYTLLCPILLVRYLSNLKTALARMASSLRRCLTGGCCANKARSKTRDKSLAKK